MAGSTFGKNFTVTTWGESHGRAVGAVIDGCPAGLPLCEEDIQVFLDRRKPGQSRFTTARRESDTVQILSGVFEGKTTGTPISLLIPNEDQRSRDYGDLASCYRPGHADYTFEKKYGIRDYRGGGRSSGRETIGRVAAGMRLPDSLRPWNHCDCLYQVDRSCLLFFFQQGGNPKESSFYAGRQSRRQSSGNPEFLHEPSGLCGRDH